MNPSRRHWLKAAGLVGARAEERRAGQDGSSRWSPAHQNNRLSVLATGAALPSGTRGRIVSAVEAFASSNSANWQSERARQAAYLVFATPAFQVQR